MPTPLVSVIVPLYESQATLGACLRAMSRQTFRNFEVILVDSSPHETAARLSKEYLPEAIYIHTERRLLPQAARNLGAERAGGRLLVFTDPDIYPTADWLERLVAAWRERPAAVVLGAIACHGTRWLDRGIHLCKFNVCLPRGHAHLVPLGWSGNVLVERQLFESLGGWSSTVTQGDTIFTARVRAAGHDLWFEPLAQVAHDHERIRFRGFILERYRRGREFAAIEARWNLESGTPTYVMSRLGGSLGVLFFAPLRIVKRVVFIGKAAAASSLLADYWLTLPVVLSGVGAWYAGMWAYHWRQLTRSAWPTGST